MQGKTYWIVGASEGLGRALAEALDAAGAHLILSARNAERLAELAGSLQNAVALPFNVTDRKATTQAAEAAQDADGIIYCAGLYEPMRAADWDADAAEAMCAVNFTAALSLLGHVVPAYAKRDHGHIVLIGSLAGFRGLPGAIGYGASKAALMHLGETIYADLRTTGVKTQVINPGFIKTRLTAKNDFKMPQVQSPEEAADCVLRAMQSRRFATSFPAPFSWLFRVGRILPTWVFYRLFKAS